MFNARKRSFAKDECDDHSQLVNGKKTKFECESPYFMKSAETSTSAIKERMLRRFHESDDDDKGKGSLGTRKHFGTAVKKKYKRCRFVSEGSSSDSDDADNSLLTKDTESKNSVQKTPAAAAATNQLAQLSSSDDDGKASAASEIGTSIEAESEKLHSGNNNIKDAAVEDPAVENNSNVTAIAASQLAQLSSSDEDPNSSSAVPDVDKSTLSKSKSNFVIAISKRAIAGPRSSADVLKRPHSSQVKPKKLPSSQATGSTRNKIDDGFDVDRFDSGEDWSSDEEGRISVEKQTKIREFFQESSAEELTTVAECSVKKAGIIMSLRPFTSWDDLWQKFTETKHLTQRLIWSCMDILHERRTLCALMKKCAQISKKLERQFNEVRDLDTQSPKNSASMTVTDQPKNIPSDLVLKPYQLIGLNWIALLDKNKVNGILADEMGLGKTVQTISFFAYLQYRNAATRPHLIVVPTSTLANWVREFHTWCPSLSVLQYSGSQAERRDIRQTLLRGYSPCDVILTTYNLAISTPEDRSLFRKLGVHYAVFDEGHMLKNMSSQRFQQLLKIKAERRLLLTGTPLQNNLLELMSLLRFVMPHMFEETTSTLVRIFSHSNQETSSSFSKKRIEHAKQIMQPFVLRRLKQDVLHQLPSKEEEVVFCPLNPNQAALYEKVKTTLKTRVLKQALPKSELRSVFMELRKVANHPLLRRELFTMTTLAQMAVELKNDVEFMDSDQKYLVEDMEVMSDFELHNFCLERRLLSNFKLAKEQIYESGKFLQLDKILPEIANEGRRCLIFSQFTMMMDIMEAYLKHRHHKYLRLDGSTPMTERIGLIDTFNNDESYFVFILSTKAGGLGINLTSASVVILHDIDCNPYNDKQAEDRCHRVGQKQTVKVIKLIAKGTIEERIHEYAQHKLQLEKEMTKNDEDIDLATLISDSLAT